MKRRITRAKYKKLLRRVVGANLHPDAIMDHYVWPVSEKTNCSYSCTSPEISNFITYLVQDRYAFEKAERDHRKRFNPRQYNAALRKLRCGKNIPKNIYGLNRFFRVMRELKNDIIETINNIITYTHNQTVETKILNKKLNRFRKLIVRFNKNIKALFMMLQNPTFWLKKFNLL